MQLTDTQCRNALAQTTQTHHNREGLIVIVITSLSTKLPRPEDSEDFASCHQPTCLPHTAEASHRPLLNVNRKAL